MCPGGRAVSPSRDLFVETFRERLEYSVAWNEAYKLSPSQSSVTCGDLWAPCRAAGCAGPRNRSPIKFREYKRRHLRNLHRVKAPDCSLQALRLCIMSCNQLHGWRFGEIVFAASRMANLHAICRISKLLAVSVYFRTKTES